MRWKPAERSTCSAKSSKLSSFSTEPFAGSQCPPKQKSRQLILLALGGCLQGFGAVELCRSFGASFSSWRAECNEAISQKKNTIACTWNKPVKWHQILNGESLHLNHTSIMDSSTLGSWGGKRSRSSSPSPSAAEKSRLGLYGLKSETSTKRA